MSGEHPTTDVVHLLRAVTVELDLAAARFAHRHRLGGSDLRALIALLDAERAGVAATPGWLAGQLQISSASTTALVDRLTERDLLERRADPGDRRRTLLAVTEGAREMGQDFFGPLITRITDVVQTGFDLGEQAVLHRLLATLATEIKHPDTPPRPTISG